MYLSKQLSITEKEAFRMVEEQRPRVSFLFHSKLSLLRNVPLTGKKLKRYHTNRFLHACLQRNVDQIRKMAGTIDINNTRFKRCLLLKSPLTASLHREGKTDITELLLSLGAVVSPYDAYHMFAHIGGDYPLSYLDFFKERGYNLSQLATEYRGPYSENEESDDEELWYTSDEDD
jgi:hypothetical protein